MVTPKARMENIRSDKSFADLAFQVLITCGKKRNGGAYSSQHSDERCEREFHEVS